MEYRKRKKIRLEGYDYSSPGYYFITVCTLNKQKLLCEIREPDVGTVALDGPVVRMTTYGSIVEKQLEDFRDYYPDIKIDAYVIMPNHVHMMLHILEPHDGPSGCGGQGPSGATVPTGAVEDGPSGATVPTGAVEDGPSGATVPTGAVEDGPSRATVPTGAVEGGPSRATVPTSKIGRFVGTVKRFCNREIGRNIWQERSNDRVIRDERHYLNTLEYMENNPLRWLDDDYYVP